MAGVTLLTASTGGNDPHFCAQGFHLQSPSHLSLFGLPFFDIIRKYLFIRPMYIYEHGSIVYPHLFVTRNLFRSILLVLSAKNVAIYELFSGLNLV